MTSLIIFNLSSSIFNLLFHRYLIRRFSFYSISSNWFFRILFFCNRFSFFFIFFRFILRFTIRFWFIQRNNFFILNCTFRYNKTYVSINTVFICKCISYVLNLNIILNCIKMILRFFFYNTIFNNIVIKVFTFKTIVIRYISRPISIRTFFLSSFCKFRS